MQVFFAVNCGLEILHIFKLDSFVSILNCRNIHYLYLYSLCCFYALHLNSESEPCLSLWLWCIVGLHFNIVEFINFLFGLCFLFFTQELFIFFEGVQVFHNFTSKHCEALHIQFSSLLLLKWIYENVILFSMANNCHSSSPWLAHTYAHLQYHLCKI